ncbi:uncharacterized protein [Oscarella lobularis]|uniref:uncharacterized protein n=1 Tax=Oscarella lobularis TaxID=121494 RepID=UPI0033139C6C
MSTRTKSGRGGKDRTLNASPSTSSNTNVRLIALTILLIAIATAFLWPGLKTRPSGSPDANCDSLLRQAGELTQHGSSGYEPALRLLAKCLASNASHVAARWNVGVVLLKLGRQTEALEHLRRVAMETPLNAEYQHGAGTLMTNLGHYSDAVTHLERYVELILGIDDFSDTIARASDSNPEDLDFIVAEGDSMTSALEKLLKAYLRVNSLRKAGHLYRILLGLDEASIDLHASYQAFAFGLGAVGRGFEYVKREMRLRFVAGGAGSVEDAYDVIDVHAARLLAAGFDANVVNVARNALIVNRDEMKSLLIENCGGGGEGELSIFARAHEVKQSDVRALLARCVRSQRVLDVALNVKGALHSENQFGWNAFLNAVALGDVDIVKTFLHYKADVQGRTFYGMTSLHVAALRGHSHLVRTLTQAGLSPTIEDYYNRTALDIACLHRWSFDSFAKALGASTACSKSALPRGKTKRGALTGGGWLEDDFALPSSLIDERCDIDVTTSDDVTADILIRDYLTVQRPVLIRGGVARWRHLRTALQRRNLESTYGKLLFKKSAIPYAEAFGLPANVTTLKEFLADLSQLHATRKSSGTDSVPDPNVFAPYIFESLSSNSPLIELFELPSSFDPEVTHVTTKTVQFYVGPSLSGAPVHFHGSAWNSLIYGKKRWFLYPPPSAFYSKRPVWEWYRTEYQSDAMECVQEAGDVLYVPDMWGHGVINLQESVGFASEFIYGASEFSI